MEYESAEVRIAGLSTMSDFFELMPWLIAALALSAWVHTLWSDGK